MYVFCLFLFLYIGLLVLSFLVVRPDGYSDGFGLLYLGLGLAIFNAGAVAYCAGKPLHLLLAMLTTFVVNWYLCMRFAYSSALRATIVACLLSGLPAGLVVFAVLFGKGLH